MCQRVGSIWKNLSAEDACLLVDLAPSPSLLLPPLYPLPRNSRFRLHLGASTSWPDSGRLNAGSALLLAGPS